MANFFDSILGDAKGLEEKIIGPDYKYYQQINSPSELKMGSDGSMTTITNNISGLLGYVKVLSAGGGPASKTNKPLGNKFFLETGAKCNDKETSEKVTRSLYINNVPDGTIPFLSAATGGGGSSEFEGLIPGVMGNMANMNPLKLFQAFMSGSNPECQAIEMPTIDNNNQVTMKTAYVINEDIADMNACWFPNKRNPVTGNTCKEGFASLIKKTDLYADKVNFEYSQFPDDLPTKLYFSSLGLLGLFIFLLIYKKSL